ncbi:MAG: hypothetical protein Q9167_005679 [Letrouitia subvulpina]
MAPQIKSKEAQNDLPHSYTSDEHSDLKSHRTTRASVTGRKFVNYDLKSHPMDEFLRPAAHKARQIKLHQAFGTQETLNIYRRSGSQSTSEPQLANASTEQASSVISSTTSYSGNDDPSRETSPGQSLHSLSQEICRIAQNPFVEPVADGWEFLTHLDRRLFKLQKGTPYYQRLPFKWCQVAEKLIKEFFFSSENLQSWGGWPALASRYSVINLKVEAFFGVKPESASKPDWNLMYAEDFDVYELQSGEKYWHRSHNAIVRPAKRQKGGQGHIKLGEVLRDSSEEPLKHAIYDHTSAVEIRDSADREDPPLCGSYNDAESFLRQTYGPYVDTESTDSDDELFASMCDVARKNFTDIMPTPGLERTLKSGVCSPNASSSSRPIQRVSGRTKRLDVASSNSPKSIPQFQTPGTNLEDVLVTSKSTPRKNAKGPPSVVRVEIHEDQLSLTSKIKKQVLDIQKENNSQGEGDL